MNMLSRRNLFYNFLIWSQVAVFTATQLHLKSSQSGQASSWMNQFQIQLFVWWIWGLFTPMIVWLVNRFRIDRGRLIKGVLIHLGSSVSIVCVYLALYSLVWNMASQDSFEFQMFKTIYIVLFLNLFHWHFFIYMAILAIMHARSFYFEVKEKELKSVRLEKDLLESQLAMLKMQLQPHFLFNALNSIVSSIHREKLETAVNMTTGLSELLRISLAEAEEQLVPLSKEIHHLKTYLEIEGHRFKDLEVVYELADSLLDHQVPNFLLQPILENSIKHGISQKQDAKRINISIKEENQGMNISIFNEGPPLSNNQNEGIGVSNIKKRLKSFYQDGATFVMKTLNNGVVTEIYLPI